MKKGLLLIYGLLLTFFATNVKAQDFDLEFYNYFNNNKANFGTSSTDALKAFTAWRGSKTDGTAPVYTITQNGISAYVTQNNRINNITGGLDPATDGTQYLRAQVANVAAEFIIESNADLATIAIQYRGTSDTGVGEAQVSYGSSAASLSTTSLGNVTSIVPGVGKFFDFPTDLTGATNVRYVKITCPKQTRIYRFTTSKTTFTAFPALPPLPLNFLSFTAKPDAFGKSVNLDWRTTNEVNTKEFSIERRSDNTEFAAIGTLDSKNVDGIINYSFVDRNPVTGNAYYRLKQIDKDGAFKYSDVVSANITSNISLSVYPNPTSAVLNISYAAASKASLKVFNLEGKTLLEKSLNNGSTSSNIDISGFTSGTYLLLLNNQGARSTIKFVKN